jgi:hypothetical protein
VWRDEIRHASIILAAKTENDLLDIPKGWGGGGSIKVFFKECETLWTEI